MPAIVNNDIRVLSANQFLNAFQSQKYSPWVTGQVYSTGDVVYNSFYKYIATSTGTSGATAPAHTSGKVSDGGVTWIFIEAFQNTANFDNNLYIAIGRVNPWDNPTVGDETPVDPVDNAASQYDNLANILSAKRLEANAVKLAIKRYDWEGGQVYSQFDPMVAGFGYANSVYVMADNKVYKCLNNNGGAVSITQPTGTSVDPIVTSGDGYVWKYMCSVDPSDAIQFLSKDYIPIELKLSDDGSTQWAVQQNAKKNSISTFIVTNGGSGYTNANVTVSDPVQGTTATGNAIVEGGVVTAIHISSVGEGYTTVPTVTISGDGTGATAEAVLAPKDGHGANALKELDARYVIINARFDDNEGGYFPITGEKDFRQISIIADPLEIDGSPAEAPRYIGADHDDWDGAGTSGKSELMKGSGTTLYIENVQPVDRAPGQIEDLKITLKF